MALLCNFFEGAFSGSTVLDGLCVGVCVQEKSHQPEHCTACQASDVDQTSIKK